MYKAEYEITYTSDSWHAGTRMECDDALKKGYKAMKAICHAEKEQKLVEIVSASSGSTVNMHPSKCVFIVRSWYGDSINTLENVTNNIKNILNELQEQDPAMKYEMKML